MGQPRSVGGAERRCAVIAERSDLAPDPVTILAPAGALAWTVADGFVLSVDIFAEARIEGATIIGVHDGTITVDGLAPLAAVVRLDRDVAQVRQRLAAVEATLGK